ncbi:long-chain-fatty-acid--CoA ligase [Pseudomarimonas salicorniae]|uniref:Long-chain-fatty-acid--CoA ligase n=1 Tax=Pseudomarimonas salicorniae TaxID=2933270 RepID=A0ABT0GHD2_9GAMM|nr:long-chain-fatty-acid--CoA ligase [Lysobacter sp. CAU 1642]MCK7593947.1 long-chain-fatty-acid--CoA ligase [Lysobacter sp. CAU 1642]
MEKIWLKHYPAGVPATVDTSGYSSVVALIEESFRKYGDNPAYVCMGRSISFADLDRLSARFGAFLQSRGLQRGDRVAVMLPNVLQYPVAAAAVLRAGFVLVNVNPLYTPRELRHQMEDSGAKAIVVLENFAATVEKVLPDTGLKLVVVCSMGDLLGFPKGAIVDFMVRRVKKLVPPFSLPTAVSFKQAMAEGARGSLSPATLEQDDVAVLQYTGGTTGVAKGAVLLHRSLIAALLSSEAWMQPGLKRRPTSGPLTILCALPLYHVFAFVTCGLLGMRTGGCNILIPNPRDIPGLVATLKQHRINIFPAVNTLFNAVANHPDAATVDWSELLISNGGGTAIQQAVAERWLALTGCPVVEGYGLSESSSGITCNPTDSDAYTGTIGMPMPNADLRLVDDEDQDVAPGQPGEIALKSPQMMAGYWQRPEETAKSMTEDGYFKTGDIGVIDERGYLKIVDRKKDMILVSGFNVYPNEVEAVAAGCPGVLETCAIGVPDEASGEAVKLFVVRKDPALTIEAVKAYLSEHLTGYKKPRHIEFRDELPKTPVGKILRRELRDEEMKKRSA